MTTTLLAVDDSKTIRRVLEITFAGENYRTVLANGADDAMKKLRSERPAVALLDAGLGSASGYDLCQQMKRESPGVAVIILSSKQAPYDRARGSSVGADDFIDKPFDTQQLIDKVRAAVRKGLEAPAAAVQVAAAPVQSNAPAAATFANRGRANTLAYGTSSSEPAGPQPNTVPSQRAPTFTGTPLAPAQAAPAASPAASYASPSRTSPFAQPVASRGHSSPPTQQTGAQSFAQSATPLGGMSSTSARQVAAEPPAQTPTAGAVAPAKSAVAHGTPALAATAADGQFAEKLATLGLTRDQVQGVLALSREVVEQVVWEVVPVLAETLIKEEIRRLTDS